MLGTKDVLVRADEDVGQDALAANEFHPKIRMDNLLFIIDRGTAK